MKKLLIIAFAVASLATAFTSCKKDVSEEELLKNQLAQADSLLKRGGVIKYTVKVVSTANSSMLKSKMSIENASVTVYQNDKVFTGQTDAMGFVTFDNMRVGTVAVNVTLKDHAEVDYVADITPQEQLSNLSQSQVVNTIRYASTMVPMFPIADPGCATITGKVTAELDLTNTTPEPAPGVKVTAMVDVDDPDFVSRYIAPTLSSGTPSAGRILKYAFSDATITATTDAQGVYTMKVPASLNGLPIRISVGDYQATQKLYLENDPTTEEIKPATYNVNAIFSKEYPASEIPSIKPIYIQIDNPTVPLGKRYAVAQFTFELDANGGFTKVNVINGGKYSCKPYINAYFAGSGAEFDAIFDTNTGQVTSVNIISGGKNYTASQTNINAFVGQNIKPTIIEPIIQSNGDITSFKILDPGFGYVKVPNYTIINLNNNTVSPEIQIECAIHLMQLSNIIVTKKGSGFNNSTKNFPTTPQNSHSNITFQTFFNNISIANIDLGTGKRP